MYCQASLSGVCLLAILGATIGHLSRLPGRFSRPSSHDVLHKTIQAVGCDTSFKLVDSDGNSQEYSFNFSELQVDIGGYIANNDVDTYSYCINVCKVVTSERNCICYPCGSSEYPSTQVKKDPTKGETCQAYLGSLEQSQWGWIDTKHAHLGVALRYSGGQNGDSTVIRFMCDPKTDGVNEGPTFVSGATQGAYLFQWNTSFACLK
eukprot:m.1095499 g.1095499  ORF g.1095499 m.1095499 type:complete len:206 (-) comp24303_c1_seq48:58-675(-)